MENNYLKEDNENQFKILNVPTLKSIKDIRNIFYINLSSREDRKKNVEYELEKLGLYNYQRFNAIKVSSGAIGCSMSHLKCLEIAKEKNYDHIFICEDDIQFLDPELFTKQLNSFLQKNHPWDVILVAGNNMLPYKKIDDVCIQVMHCQTTTGYIVKKHYYDTLINNYKNGIKKLMQNPDKSNLYAIDKYWLQLQQEGKWYLIIPLSVIQRENYSDIEQKIMNYKSYMLNYDKCYAIESKINLKKSNVSPSPSQISNVLPKIF